MTTVPVRDSLTISTADRHARRLPIPAAWPVRSGQTAHRWAIVSAGLAPVLLTGAYLVAGILQPAAYSPVRTTISAMAGQAGTDRRVMTGGIFLAGGCYLVTAAGLTGVRASARALLAVAGLAERLTSTIQTCWPFIIAITLRRTARPRPGLATGGSGGVKDGATAEAGPAAAVSGQAGESPGSGDGCSPGLVIRLQKAIRALNAGPESGPGV